MKRVLAATLLLLSSAPVLAGPAETRLAQAVRDNDVRAMRAAIAAKANVNAPLPDHSTVLAWAVKIVRKGLAENQKTTVPPTVQPAPVIPNVSVPQSVPKRI